MRLDNQRATVRMAKALRDTGRLEPVDWALVVCAISTARNFDSAPPGTTECASAARAHLEAIRRLQAVNHGDTRTDNLLERITSVRDPSHP